MTDVLTDDCTGIQGRKVAHAYWSFRVETRDWVQDNSTLITLLLLLADFFLTKSRLWLHHNQLAAEHAILKYQRLDLDALTSC